MKILDYEKAILSGKKILLDHGQYREEGFEDSEHYKEGDLRPFGHMVARWFQAVDPTDVIDRITIGSEPGKNLLMPLVITLHLAFKKNCT